MASAPVGLAIDRVSRVSCRVGRPCIPPPGPQSARAWRRQLQPPTRCWHTALAPSAAILCQLLGRRRSGRRVQVARQGLIEPFILGAAAVAYFAQPKSAPGPSEQLITREERARREVAAAREALRTAGPEEAEAARKRLDESLRRLSMLETEVEGAIADAEEYPLPDYLKSSYTKGRVMIGVTGASGVGKSSYINALRKMRLRDEGAAKTGITETTLEPEMFAFPKKQGKGIFRRTFNRILDKGRGIKDSIKTGFAGQTAVDDEPIQVGDRVLLRGVEAGLSGRVAEVVAEHGSSSLDVKLNGGEIFKVKRDQLTGVLAECVIWDLPGVGTPNFPQATYIKEMGVRYFDVVVVMTATRFTEAELLLVKELKYWKIPFFMVRNKADADVRSELEIEQEVMDEEEEGATLSKDRQKEIKEETVQTIKDFFRIELKLDKVYCISTKRKFLKEYDFQDLEADIEKEVNRQRSADMTKECPICLEIYTDNQGPSGHQRRRQLDGTFCCEDCLPEASEEATA